MKVTGPGAQIPTAAPEETKAPKTAEGANFTDKLDRTSGTKEATATSVPPKASAALGKLTGDIAAALARKEITPEAAVDQVVSRILDKQVGPETKSATRANVETAIRDALETDPVLAAKVKSLAD